MNTLFNKEKYIIQYNNLVYALGHGLNKIHIS